MKGGADLELTCDLGPEVVTMDWSLDTITDGPDDRFIMLDEDGEPRLILHQDELLELQGGAP